MKIRSTAASLALVAGLGLALAGCGKMNEVRAMKAFKDGNKLYAGNDWRAGRGEVRGGDPARSRSNVNSCGSGPGCVYFYLANSYDNMYRPTRKGEPANDELSRRPSPTTSWRREDHQRPEDEGRCRCSIWSPPTAPTS